ncbi:MAG: right-handed parallel beta-helix repeat-containing protein [Saprospiraceae bacterium]
MLLTTTMNAQFIPEECSEKPEFQAKYEVSLCELFGKEEPDITIGTDINSNTNASTLGFTITTSQKIRINGKLHLNATLIFLNCVLEFGPGAEIFIQANRTMFAYGSKLYACDDMWRGIVVKPHGQLTLNTCHVEDAQYAISAEDNAFLSLLSNRFNRNYVGIRNISPTGGSTGLNFNYFSGNTFLCSDPLNGPYPSQAPTPGEVSYAGILLSKCVASIGKYDVTANAFARMHYGIHATKSTVVVQNCTFRSMIGLAGDNASATGIFCENSTLIVKGVYQPGTGLYLGSSFFEDCGYSGILAIGSNTLNIANNYFLGEQTYGISSKANLFSAQIQISRNTFEVSETANVAGVLLERSSSSGGGIHNVITRNAIVMAGATDAKYGIHVTCPFAASDRMEITHNKITVTNTADLIFPIYVAASLADKFQILNDTINFTSSNFAAERWGISMVDGYGSGHLIKENRIIGSGTHNPGQCAIHVDNARNVNICANYTDHTLRGIHLLGALDPCKVQNNDLNAHGQGVFISPGSIGVPGIGTQLRHGNIWSTTSGDYTLWAAECHSFVDPFLSRFITESTDPSILPSSALLSPSTGWFSYLAGDGNYCVPLPPSFSDDLSGLQEETATGGLDTYIDTPLDEWEMEYALMLNLRNNPDLLQNTDAQSFFTANSNTTAGSLSHSLFGLKTAMTPGLTEQGEIDDIRKYIEIVIDTLIALGNSYTTPPDTTTGSIDTTFLNAKQLLVLSLLDYMEEQQDWIDDMSVTRTAALAALKDFNATIIVPHKYEENHKILNNYLIQLALGAATNTDYEDIVDIATQQSPDTTGSAVRFVRNLLPLCEQANYLEDEAASEESLEVPRPGVAAPQPDPLTVYPNPADGSLNIRLLKGIAGKLLVRNADGKIMYNREIGEQNGLHLQVDTRQWPVGIYLCTIQDYSGDQGRWISFIIVH